jgi:hypothetical protein
MSTVIGWGYISVAAAFCVWHYRTTSVAEFQVADNSRRVKLPWWLPGSNWVWDRNYWGVIATVLWPLLVWPYLLFIRPRLAQARMALATHGANR